MNKILAILALVTVAYATTHAQSKLPRGVYEPAQLEAALAEAKSKNRPIAFLYSARDSKCPLCVRAHNTFMEEFDRAAVIVFIEYKDFAKLPVAVRDAQNKDTGKYIPKMFIFSPDMSRLITTAHYEKLAEGGEKYIKEIKRELRAAGA